MAGSQGAEEGDRPMSNIPGSVDERLRRALLPFGDPVENVVYQGKAERYYTFSYSTLGTGFGDDTPSAERYLVTVHFFAPLKENVTKRVKATKQALFHAGFTWAETVNATDENGRHIVFECETAEGVELYAAV